MTTLHRVTEATKKVLIGFSIGIGSIIFLILLFQVIVGLKASLFPTPPPPPTVSFGKLPQLIFPASKISGNFTYTLNTISGSLPLFPDRETVYQIQQPQANLLSFSDAQQLLGQNGFTASPKAISESVYSWQQATTPFLVANYNIVNRDFAITSSFATDQNVLAALNLPSQNAAVAIAKQYLANFSTNVDDIDNAKTVVSLFTIQNGALSPALSLSNAKIVQVNFFQKSVNSLPIVYPNSPNSTVEIQIGSGEKNPQVIEAVYTHKIILTSQSATYPIITAQQAYDALKSGKAYIANYDGTSNSVVIKNIYLAYYLGDTVEKYAMPVIVLQGDNNFYAFVSAITDSQVQK